VRVSGVALDRVRLAGPGQRLAGDTLIVEQGPAAALAPRYTLPARDAEFLRPEPLVQSGDPRIVTQARQIVGGERDPARAARLIGDWVHGSLDRNGKATLPSARQVL